MTLTPVTNSTTIADAIDRLVSAITSAQRVDPDVLGGSDLAQLQRAAPVARAVALFGNPLDMTQDAIENFINAEDEAATRARLAEADPSDSDGSFAGRAASDCAYFHIGLALGLIVAGRV